MSLIETIAELLARLFGRAPAPPQPASPSAPPAPKPAGDPPWLTVALSLIGTYEAPGAADNPVILQWARDCGFKDYKHDSIPWCALFVAECLRRAGFPHSKSLLALSYADYGVDLDGPAVGAIVSKRRQGGGHVAIVEGRDSHGNLICVGGNVSDRVQRQAIRPAEAVAYTWPEGYPRPAAERFEALPLTGTAARAASEA